MLSLVLAVSIDVLGLKTGSDIWLATGTILIGITLAYLIYGDRRARAELNDRRKKLQGPCPVQFLIPKVSQTKLDYIVQDSEEHRTYCLVVPSKRKIVILLVFKPLVSFRENGWYLGCKGETDGKPEVIGVHNPFILRGLSDSSPETDSNQYVDFHHYYHIVGQRERSIDETYVPGFWLQTTTPGVYEMEVLFDGTERMGRALLTLVVENTPTEHAQCTQHSQCFIAPLEIAGESK